MLSHGNYLANVAASSAIFEPTPSDVHCSYLPLAHVYERLIVSIMIRFGASIGFYRGSEYRVVFYLYIYS